MSVQLTVFGDGTDCIQVHLSFAGPGAVTVSWVTWPQDDPEYESNLLQSYAYAHRKISILSLPAEQTYLHKPAALVSMFQHWLQKKSDDSSGHCKRLLSFLHNNGPETSVVQWGTHSGKYDYTVIGPKESVDCYSTRSFDSGALHHVTIGIDEGPLPSSTRIYYRVGNSGKDEWSEEASFVTSPLQGPDSFPYRLGLIGDLGQTENSASTLQHLAGQNVDSVMFVGDLSYADGLQPRWDTWGRLVSPYTSSLVWMYTEGNHEIEETKGAPTFLAYTKRFRAESSQFPDTMPLYYSYDVAGVHVIMLGSYTDFDKHSDQYEWLKTDLESIDRSKTPWVIVGMHAPWYNSNYHHYGEGEPMRKVMEKLLYENGVDAVISGHVHAYERSIPTYDNKPSTCGPTYINIGDGGNREGLDFDYFAQPSWSAYREPSYGHGVLDFINGTHAAFTWHRNQDGVSVVADQVVLAKNHACTGMMNI